MGTIEKGKEKLKLYDIPNNTKIKILGEVKVPPGALNLEIGNIIDFKHINGMYSLCHKDGVSCHLAGWTEVEIVTLKKI